MSRVGWWVRLPRLLFGLGFRILFWSALKNLSWRAIFPFGPVDENDPLEICFVPISLPKLSQNQMHYHTCSVLQHEHVTSDTQRHLKDFHKKARWLRWSSNLVFHSKRILVTGCVWCFICSVFVRWSVLQLAKKWTHAAEMMIIGVLACFSRGPSCSFGVFSSFPIEVMTDSSSDPESPSSPSILHTEFMLEVLEDSGS